jgi:hypothetical protein
MAGDFGRPEPSADAKGRFGGKKAPPFGKSRSFRKGKKGKSAPIQKALRFGGGGR